MLKQLVKLALAALIANAVWRVGAEYVTHLRFREAVRLATAAAGPNDEPLRIVISAQAARYGVPQTGHTVGIEREERRITVTGTYNRSIEVVPGYPYPWTFDWEVEVFVAPSINQGSPRP